MGVIKAISGGAARRPRDRPQNVEASRIHLSLPESLLNRLQEIQRDTHANSLTEVVKAALQLYAAAVEEHKSGGQVCFKDKEGRERQLALFI
jgi:Ribbon-helix-helix protein, copG family